MIYIIITLHIHVHVGDSYRLPTEMWKKVLGLVIGKDDLMAYKRLQTVCHLFNDVVKMIPRPNPKIYLDACTCHHLQISPTARKNIISYPFLLTKAGMGSGAAIALHRMFAGSLRQNNVLVLRHIAFNWFQIDDILCLPSSINETECESVPRVYLLRTTIRCISHYGSNSVKMQ